MIHEAIISFQRACKIKADFAIAHLNLANLFAKLEKNESAQMQYQLALKSSDLSASERAIACNNLAVLYAKNKNWEESSEYLLQALGIESNMVSQMNYALVLLALHEYDLAANKFAQILKIAPNNLEANFYYGLSLLCFAKFEESLSKLKQALQIAEQDNKKSAEFYWQILLWLAYAYLANKEYNNAITELNKLISLQTSDNAFSALIFDALGVCFLLQKQFQEAKQSFTQALQLDNQLAIAYLHRASSYEALHEIPLAKADYAQALKFDPDILRDSKDYISQLLSNAQIEAALTQAIKLQQLKPQDMESRLLLARAYQKKNEYDQALTILTSILKEAPNKVEAHTMLGQIYMSQGDFAKADDIFQNASKLENIEAELFLSWARALAYLGFHELALEKFKEASGINPYDSNIYESWAQALKSLGRFNEASEVYRLASSYL